MHGVAGCILHVNRGAGVFAVLDEALDFVEFLVKRAAEGYIQLLKPAADAKHGNASSERGTDQGEGGAITVRVMQRARRAGRAVIQMRFDIGG